MTREGEVTEEARCDKCRRPTEWCACAEIAHGRECLKREQRAVEEAYRYRRLWQCAAACLAQNASKIRARGADEARMLELAAQEDVGVFWAGTTKGWIEW